MKTVIFTLEGEHTERLHKQATRLHPDIEFVIIKEADTKDSGDPLFMERATPSIATMLFKDYEQVIKIDSSVQLEGSLDELLNDTGEWATMCVLNFNPKSPPEAPSAVWDVHPLAYTDSRFMIMRDKNFATDWLAMCHKPFFANYKGKENDVLNMLVYYGDYKSKITKISELKGTIKI